MPSATRLGFALLALVGLLLAACSDGTGSSGKEKDSSVETDAGGQDAASADGGNKLLTPCLESPDELPRPPSGELPCELLPPGFQR